MPAPRGAVGFKLVDPATGRWLGPKGPTAAEPAPTPCLAGTGTAGSTVFAPAASFAAPAPGRTYWALFYDAAGKRVGLPVPFVFRKPAKLNLILAGQAAQAPPA
jgi:hypothetical protein